MVIPLLLLACSPDAASPGTGDSGHDSGEPADPPCADLNCDGWPDLVLSSTSELPSLVYWGGPDGFDEDAITEVPTEWTRGVLMADLDTDGDMDLAFSRMGVQQDEAIFPEAESYVFLTTSTDPWEYETVLLPTVSAHGVATGDLDGDDWPDLVFSNHGGGEQRVRDSVVYYGGPDGFRADAALGLPTRGAYGAGVGDVDGDGRDDVVFSNYFDGDTRLLSSYAYLNSTSGLSPDVRLEIPTVGARGNAIADLDGDGHADLVFASHYDGESLDVDSLVYWGPDFSEDARTALPTIGAHTATPADLDLDGFTDLVFTNQRPDLDWSSPIDSWIYWGGADGWSEDRRTSLPTHSAAGHTVADLDRDGWPDVALGQLHDADNNGKLGTIIYWGGPGGPDGSRSTLLPSQFIDGVVSTPLEPGF